MASLSGPVDARALADFSAVIDARSPAEYALDRLPGAVNWPSLDDDERRAIGTLYRQVSPFEARKHGAARVAANIARHIEREVLDKPRDWRPLVYCWRGGQRSGALALVLAQIGFRVAVLDGGYKAFRAQVAARLPAQVQSLRWIVLAGLTGSGKTRLLHALHAAGAQTLDLEALAHHRASVLGLWPGEAQPSQKRFETLLWQALHGLDPARPVYVECESRRIGRLSLPPALSTTMHAAPCLWLDAPAQARVRLLLEDYRVLMADVALLCDRLAALVSLRGRQQVQRWQALARAGDFGTLAQELLERHYDPGYAASLARQFVQLPQAERLTLSDTDAAALAAVARAIVRRERADGSATVSRAAAV